MPLLSIHDPDYDEDVPRRGMGPHRLAAEQRGLEMEQRFWERQSRQRDYMERADRRWFDFLARQRVQWNQQMAKRGYQRQREARERARRGAEEEQLMAKVGEALPWEKYGLEAPETREELKVLQPILERQEREAEEEQDVKRKRRQILLQLRKSPSGLDVRHLWDAAKSVGTLEELQEVESNYFDMLADWQKARRQRAVQRYETLRKGPEKRRERTREQLDEVQEMIERLEEQRLEETGVPGAGDTDQRLRRLRAEEQRIYKQLYGPLPEEPTGAEPEAGEVSTQDNRIKVERRAGGPIRLTQQEKAYVELHDQMTEDHMRELIRYALGRTGTPADQRKIQAVLQKMGVDW